MLSAILKQAARLCLLPIVLAGCQPANEPATALRDGFREYNRILRETLERLESSDYFDSSVSQAEAYRYLSGLIALQNQTQLHFGHPDHPIFTRSVAIGKKWGFSNPDNLYLSAKVTGSGTYRVTGRLGTANQTFIGSYAGDTEDARAGARMRGEDLSIGEDGEFELILGGEPTSGNWLPLDPEAKSIVIYQIFADWDEETKGTFRIERVGYEGSAPAPLEPDRVARQLIDAAAMVDHYVDAWLEVADRLSWIPANSMAPPRQIQIASLGAWFVAGRYELSPDEALIVEVPAPEARYWGWTLYNGWSETLDYGNRQTSLNLSQAHMDADRIIRIVLAAEDPGVPNWLDTAGHPKGFLAWRVTADIEPEKPSTRVVATDSIRASFPTATPRVSREMRRATIHRRQRHVALRYAD